MRNDTRTLFVSSTLLSTLAFNLTFFLQELFLVIPKAVTPGLHPVLYHNNHIWTGDSPYAPLLQGTGALADIICGVVFSVLFAISARQPTTARLFLFWTSFEAFVQGLPQTVIGAFVPQNDVGMALTYLGLSANAKLVVAVAAVAAMGAAGFWLAPKFVAAFADEKEGATVGRRFGFIARTALLPSLVMVVLSIPFRVPRNMIEVALVPLVFNLFGMIWLLAGAWRQPALPVAPQPARPDITRPAIAVVALLAFFQLVLRPGIAF
ncbi:MAG TPA: hypothetical protein VMF58_00290 [Rhizomicrobium sp.]|nr:hypothetical protein [Rhizomicrobium sp.]